MGGWVFRKLVFLAFLLSLAINLAMAAQDATWAVIPAAIVGWYAADLLSGLIHMYMDYRPCPRGKGLDELFFYEGSRESAEYQALFRDRLKAIGPLNRLVYDFKNHHPRPDALGRRDMWRLIGTTVILGALPFSLVVNAASLYWGLPRWIIAGCSTFLVGGAFAQYFHGTLHRAHNPAVITIMRMLGLLMTPAAHQLHHDTLRQDFATNCGWSNPLCNWVFGVLRKHGHLHDEGLVPLP
jgi:hypothetical protein